MFSAEKYLARFGWKKGVGLGKQETGIKTYVHAVKKPDQKGVGCKNDAGLAPEWAAVFNNAAQNVRVDSNGLSGGAVVASVEDRRSGPAAQPLVFQRFRAGPSLRPNEPTPAEQAAAASATNTTTAGPVQ